MSSPAPYVLGLDFGTTNSVAAIARDGHSSLVELESPAGTAAVFRSALCFWEDDTVRGGIASAGGPWAIAEYLEFPGASRFIQSFKSVAASATFERATIFERQFKFEDLGRLFLDKMAARADGAFSGPARVVVGRPVVYAGHAPDEAIARRRYDAMFAGIGATLHYVYEPLGAAFSYASRVSEPATVLVADFGGGTSDFSVVRIEAPGATRRCVPLGHAGVGIAGDRFDARIVEQLVMPLLGKGGFYRSFGKILEIPGGYFADFADWSRLALMRNRRTLAELESLRRSALDPDAIGRVIAVIEQELGFRLHEAVGQVKRDLSAADTACFRFSGAGLTIEADVTRAAFEGWIAPDIERIEAAIDRALAMASTTPGAIDHVFLTGGTSLTPRIVRLFEERFGAERLAKGNELTSIAHGLALIGEQAELAAWTA
ncbi:Hsp70 family protein [Polymorphobacter sp. PAMC 29334]|uniref:Hsp70 family protein n=1 Tax=Polymorphobacter sp. PAMC 29334 TaxID=2862331 RepID=UPI001C67ED23|nr:Hsp70 family protein [Polymorphobacter sp. PAMC 29334]QYE34726.1 Hsp70 family protein [Polymorphobacter sp. PAMC 29334]